MPFCLTADNKKQAEKLIATIEGMPISDEEAKKELFKHGIMAFETLALKGNISALDQIENIDAESLEGILNAMSQLDSAHYYQIAKNRFAVLNEIRRLVDDGEKEKLIQETLFKELWLMEASWEHATEDADMEKRFSFRFRC